MIKTALLVDGAFFLKRYSLTYGKKHPPKTVAKNLFTMCIRHLDDKFDLYRIFFYDCPPLSKKAQHPLTGTPIDFSKTSTFAFRTELHRELVKQRKLAVRLGRLADGTGRWVLTERATKEILRKSQTVDQLVDNDVRYEVTQKGVDMRIGLDISSLAHKKLVDRIVLVAGDADFVPAAKLARREGIDVILDPMWQPVSDDLLEHVDGVKSVCKRP